MRLPSSASKTRAGFLSVEVTVLLVVIGGLFVVEALSVVIQVAVFRTTRRRPPASAARRASSPSASR